MQARPLHLKLASGLAALFVLLAAAPSAFAHHGSPASVASDYEARLAGFRPAVAGLSATATGGDIDLVLHVPADREVVVLGVEGEPFLRFAGGLVFANVRSPTAGSARVVTLTSGTLSGPPIWREVHRGLSFGWHEQRLRPVPTRRQGRVAPIAIPLRVDGARVTLTGASWHADAPSFLIWLGPLLAVLIAAAATLRQRDRLRPRLVLPLAAVAVATVVATVVGATLYEPHSGFGAAAEIGAAALLGGGALVALVVVREPHRAFVATAAGGLCVLFAATSVPVLTHGYALSRLPTDVARLTTATAIAASGWLLLVGGAELFEQSRQPGRLSSGGRKLQGRRMSARRQG